MVCSELSPSTRVLSRGLGCQVSVSMACPGFLVSWGCCKNGGGESARDADRVAGFSTVQGPINRTHVAPQLASHNEDVSKKKLVSCHEYAVGL